MWYNLGSMNKRILSIQDISCVGQCSLTVALPIISAAGIETSILPSAVLSTHTAAPFGKFTFRDLTEDLPLINKHWIEKDIKFDAIYTGYIGNKAQVEYILNIVSTTLKEGAPLIVDPAMGDNGKLYVGFDKDFVKHMAKLCAKADVMLPNLTEAAYLLDEECKLASYDKTYIESIVRKLAKLGAKIVILTGVSFSDKELGVCIYDSIKDETAYYLHDKIGHSFHGTGDVFSSSFVGAYLNGKSCLDSAKIAANFTKQSIALTIDNKDEHWYGVNFEKVIPKYIKDLGLN